VLIRNTGIHTQNRAAVCNSVLQRVAVCRTVPQRVAACCSALQCVTVYCRALQCGAVCCSVLTRDSGIHSHDRTVRIWDLPRLSEIQGNIRKHDCARNSGALPFTNCPEGTVVSEGGTVVSEEGTVVSAQYDPRLCVSMRTHTDKALLGNRQTPGVCMYDEMWVGYAY